MITDTEWERLLNPVKTVEHIHAYANDVYHNRLETVDRHILYTLKCISKLSKKEQKDWHIVHDVVYHMPTYRRTQHRYDPENHRWISQTGRPRGLNTKHAHSSD